MVAAAESPREPSTSERSLSLEHFDREHGGVPVRAPEPPRAVPAGEALPDTWERLVRERAALEAAERAVLERAVRESDGVLAHAARSLRMPRTTLISRLGRAGMPPK